MTGIELLVGGWFASPVIKRVLEKAMKYVGGNYKLNKNTEELIDTLTGKLALCQETVKVAERRMINSEHLAVWLNKLKRVVYDAEDVLDDMETKSIKDQVEGKNKVRQYASSSLCGITNMILPGDLSKRLKKVVDKLTKLSAENQYFLNLVNTNIMDESNDLELSHPRETRSRQSEEVKLYARQQEYLDLILDMISHPETVSSKKKEQEAESSKKKEENYNNRDLLFVIPIVGMGGVGKTALAQAVYNKLEVQQTFETNAWISVSYNLNIKLVMLKLIKSLRPDLVLDLLTLEDISKILFFIINGKRFLVVLDDMCEKIENQWDDLYETLSVCGPGSVVLITTQNRAFANRVGTFSPLVLDILEPEILWELLKNIVFGDMDISEEKRKNLEHIGKQISDKLHGLPLAAKIIGKLLRDKINEKNWRTISRNEWWNMPEGRSQILPSVAIGYQHLDLCLRQYFAYCSVFPRNSLIDKDRLVQMWIAQNFIHHNSNDVRKMEDIGREWFDKLVEMSFFQLAGDYNGYVIPNLMHDLAVIVSSDDCFYLTDRSNEIREGVRHLSVDTQNLNVLQQIPERNHIHSFFYFGFPHVDGMLSTINKILCNMKSLRVLDLSYLHMDAKDANTRKGIQNFQGVLDLSFFNFETKEPPKAIQNLTHLRFLDLSSTGIAELSHSFLNDHYHLQSLHIRQPKSTWEFQFVKLPRSINKLINLRHLNADEDTIAQISGIGQLVYLQELDEYRVSEKEGHKITELKNLRELSGCLAIRNCENVRSKEEAEQARLGDKENLNSVKLYWGEERRGSNIMDKEILDGLKPHEGVTELEIFFYKGISFPDWMTDSSLLLNLQTIRLESCTNLQALPPLGQLPSLKCLELSHLDSVILIDHCLYGSNERAFPALTHFTCDFLKSCGEWTQPTNVSSFFPRLSTLQIDHNDALRKVPFHCFSASLTALMLNGCDNLNSLAVSLHHLTSLNLLYIHDYSVSISLNTNALMLLEDLVLEDCPGLSIEGDLQSLTKLKRLEIRSCPKLMSNSMHDITNKQKGKNLEVNQVKGLRSLSDLTIDQSLLHNDYHSILGRLPSLRFLLCQGSEQGQFKMDQTLWFQELTSLQELTFLNCQFTQLPSSLVTLPSLRKVKLTSCYSLESLPENGMPASLWELALDRCSQNLVQCCQPGGEYWQIIASVPVIRIDGKVIGRPQSSAGTSQGMATFHRKFWLI
ncbi:Disease resistance protein (CC-NBS-LRR class) family [Rhynchospora pubera]|uniref:Disease resistance protein (CC-NBS-LRR class) family n=1 Tax=Rhynchospora pubera TaxID=906938 RepID=A0AAV8GF89_9POAL|nr:Disease resistance protein (CC-NBS-LRR class) family [Rhynchospora pubera]